MFEDSRSGFSAASENQWGEKVQWMFWMISASWLAWEDADRDKGNGQRDCRSMSARPSVVSSQGNKKCRPFCGRHFFKIEAA